MHQLPFGNLPPYQPRRFVPATIDLGDWSQIAPLFDRLQTAPNTDTQWLLDWSELAAALDEEAARRYIAMTCHTDDPAAEKTYLDFVEHIEPQLKTRHFQLSRRYHQHPLPDLHYAVFNRDIAVTIELFRDANIPLETQEAKLSQQYQKITGSLTVTYHGEEKTLPQMSRYLEEPNRPVRQETWELVAHRRLQEKDNFDNLFDQLLHLRRQIAANADYPNYLDYTFRQRRRFDYTPADCRQFHDTIARDVVPLLRQLHAQRRRQLGLPALRPWDLACDPLGRPPLRPFQDAAQLIHGCHQIFQRLHPDLAADFATLRDRQLLDLDNRKGKAPGGYQYTLSESRLPFIFMNAVGLQRDVETLLHEAGHAFHALACRHLEPYAYRNNVPIEFAEVASMSMELLGADHLDVFYPPADARRARITHLEQILSILCWIATVDAFQHWLYTHPDHTRAERAAHWTQLMIRFGGDVDWTGYENIRAHYWHRQLHIFLHPLYYIEYAIAQLGALQVWANARQNPVAGLQHYRDALALGGARPLPELFATAGCRFDFSAATLRPLMQLVGAELEKLTAAE